jgi:hypothetical protein
MTKESDLFNFCGEGRTLETISIDELLTYFEQEISYEWQTENSTKIRKCRVRQKALRSEIGRRTQLCKTLQTTNSTH